MGLGPLRTKNLTFFAAVARCSLAPLSHRLHESGANLSPPGFRTVRLAVPRSPRAPRLVAGAALVLAGLLRDAAPDPARWCAQSHRLRSRHAH